MPDDAALPCGVAPTSSMIASASAILSNNHFLLADVGAVSATALTVRRMTDLSSASRIWEKYFTKSSISLDLEYRPVPDIPKIISCSNAELVSLSRDCSHNAIDECQAGRKKLASDRSNHGH